MKAGKGLPKLYPTRSWKNCQKFKIALRRAPIAIPPRQGQFQFISPFGKIRPGGWSSGSPSWTWEEPKWILGPQHEFEIEIAAGKRSGLREHWLLNQPTLLGSAASSGLRKTVLCLDSAAFGGSSLASSSSSFNSSAEISEPIFV